MTRYAEQAVAHAPGIGNIGRKAGQALHQAVLKGGKPVRELVDLLHGKHLGHPLHPLLTDLVTGAWTLGTVFDLTAAVTGSEQAEWTGDRLVELGMVAAVPTALTGLADFSTAPKWAATPVTIHALVNILGVGMYTASIIERGRGNRRSGLICSVLGLGLATIGGWLGGQLIAKHKMGVDHSERFTGPTRWTPVLPLDDLPDRAPRRVEVEGAGVLLYREGNTLYAIGSVCSHAGGPLEQGEVANGCITCPWHDSVFRLSDGSVVHGPATRPQPYFQARLHDGMIELRLGNDPGAGVDRQYRAVVGAPI